jgi:hypothetical protein
VSVTSILEWLGQTCTFKFVVSKLKFVIYLSLAYLAFAFGYSFIGLVFREPTLHLHEYSLSSFILEIGGHFVFGIFAALPLLDFELIALVGMCAVLIDSDHILGTFNLDLVSRPDHSILFVFIASLVLVWVSKWLFKGIDKARLLKIGLVVPVALLAHISYDIFAAYQVFSGKGSASHSMCPLTSGWYLLIFRPGRYSKYSYFSWQ